LVKPTFRPERFVPLSLGGKRIGWVRPALATRLVAWPGVFGIHPKEISLLDPEALTPVVEALAKEGFIPGWRNERYRIADLFDIERAAARPFGLTTQAVHLNGIVGERMWLARRSATKPIDPGLLDNLVGGGVSAGLTPLQVLVKEAWEEAGISAELAHEATPGGSMDVLREVPEGVQSETIAIYDLDLPKDFQPRNQDGEVSEFQLLTFEAVQRATLTYEAELVARDYLKRRATSAKAP
jgi:8-oxo-dGTP pyrophosphatase MutT (NUDIX family)